VNGRPADLAYFIGYRIAEAYYRKTPDKAKAIADILNCGDPEKFLQQSGYAERFKKLVYNNTTTGRTPLNLAVSNDGEHFTIFDTLEDGPGEYSYPAIIQGSDDDLRITYTWNRKSIAFVRVPLSRIPK
jgi:hypothetical protein